MNPIIDLLRAHASVRKFQSKPVTEEQLKLVLECGQTAATSSFIQAYSVVEVSNTEHRKAIAAAAGGQKWIIDAPVFLVYCADLNRVQWACDQHDAGPLEGHSEHFVAATVDAALFAQNVLVAAESLGMGGVFIGGIRNDPQTLVDLLKLPEHVYPVFGMCLGWPDVQPDLKPRMPVELIWQKGEYADANKASALQAYDAQMQTYYGSRSGKGRSSNWSQQTAAAVQNKKRPHMLDFVRKQGFCIK